MKQILIHSLEANVGDLFNPDARDNCTEPWISLKDRLHRLGYDLQHARLASVEGSDWILFLDAASVYGATLKERVARHALRRDGVVARNVYRECLHARLQDRMALILLESPAIMPRNSDPRLHASFPIIFTWNDEYIDGKKFHKLRMPQPHRFPVIEPVVFANKKLLVNISANKYQNYPGELYSERRKSIRHFEAKRSDDFDLYGLGWNKPVGLTQRLLHYTPPTYTSYRGTVTHKWDTFPHYRFALCYENVRDEPGFITEKIFDCMRADCVPVYWGASNVTASIPSRAFIDRRLFKSNDELENYLVHMSEVEYECYRSAIREFLASEAFRLFLGDAFSDQIIRVLGLEPIAEPRS